MEQYIPKSALVAEIERMKVDAIQFPFEEHGTVGTCNKLLSFLDTLEVKDVDLEKEMDEWRHNHFCGKRDDKGAAGEWLTRKSQLDIAKHFFELGLKAQKGE